MKVKSLKKVETPIAELIEKFNNNFEIIQKNVIGRDEEIEALKLCLLCSGHLLLEGPAGVAKSLLARLAFKAVVSTDKDEPLVVFRKVFMPGTLPEEVFGPMSVRELRETDTVRFNTTGMLPQAHFFYGDELYRGSDSMLESMMGVLHERVFHNGIVEQKCPLITAIGTTNFVSDDPRLAAFADRWLITCAVKPAESSAMRRRILDLHLAAIDEDEIKFHDPITLKELRRLQDAVRKVEVQDQVKDLYEELVSSYKRTYQGDCYISDRRYCQAMRLVQASILLQSEGEKIENQDPSAVVSAQYALIQGRSKEHRSAMETAISQVIGTYERLKLETPEIEDFEKTVKLLMGKYDEEMSREAKRKIHEKLSAVMSRVQSIPPEEQFTIPQHVARMNKVLKDLESLKMTLEADLTIN